MVEEGKNHKRLAVQQAVLGWAADYLRDYPWRHNPNGAYGVLVAELLLKRTTATAASKVYEEFLGQFPNLTSLAESSEDKLAGVLAKVGLQQQRARAIKAMAHHLGAREDCAIPNELPSLLAVPGLGEYSARAVLSFGFDIPVAVVDSNVERVLSRAFQDLLPPRPPQRALQELADRLLPEKSHRVFNFALLDLGALVCRYVGPKCKECPLAHMCDYYKQSKQRVIKETPARYETSVDTKLRRVRQERGLSLVKLAQGSGVSKLTIIRIESGKTSPRDETLRKLATVLNVDAGELR